MEKHRSLVYQDYNLNLEISDKKSTQFPPVCKIKEDDMA